MLGGELEVETGMAPLEKGCLSTVLAMVEVEMAQERASEIRFSQRRVRGRIDVAVSVQ